jgi:type III pantothenate kinase
MGTFRKEELVFHARLRTDPMKTSDEYGVMMLQLLSTHDIAKGEVDRVIISCVVPPLLHIMVKVAEKFLGVKPMMVDSRLESGIKIKLDHPAGVGADRIVNAAAAWELFGGPCVIVDFGTATTFDVVTEKGEYIGGAIAPGIGTSLDALIEKTSMLPKVEIKKPDRAIGGGTIPALQSGIFYGYLGMVEKLVQKIGEEMEKKPFVVATGGLAFLIAGESPLIDKVEPFLTLTGLRILFEKNQGPL